MKNSTVAFFVKPPVGAGHSLKCIKSKIGQHIYFEKFLKVATLLLSQKKNFKSNLNHWLTCLLKLLDLQCK